MKKLLMAATLSASFLGLAQVGVGTSTPIGELSVQMQQSALSTADTNDGITLLDSAGGVLFSISANVNQGVYFRLPDSTHVLSLDQRNLNFDAGVNSRALVSCGRSQGSGAPNAVYDNFNGRYRNRVFELFYNGAVGYGIAFHNGGAEFYKSSGGLFQFGYESGDDFHDFWSVGGSGNPYQVFGYAGGTSLNTNSYGVSSPRSQFRSGVWTNTTVVAEGNMYAAAFNTSSDRRLKSNIEQVENGMEVLMQLQPVHYTKQSSLDAKMKTNEFGFIAQDVREILPEIVRGEETDTSYLSLDYNSFIAILTRGIQEQQEVISTQDNRINDLESRLEELENKLAEPSMASIGVTSWVSLGFAVLILLGFAYRRKRA